MPLQQSREFLNAALIGLQHTLSTLDQRIAEIRHQLGLKGNAPASGHKRMMSAAARRRIAMAQKKRWAAFKAARAQANQTKAEPASRKTGMSAEGRARIAAASKKRWEAFRKQQAENAAKKTASKKPAPAAAAATAASA